jgi:tetratricopeptide (TPR) repeat protein
MSYYWTYYLFSFFMAYALRNPVAAGVLVLAFFAAQRWLPDPVVLFGTLGRIGRLKSQARMNAANLIARRDLGRAYLDLRWPRTALKWLDEARSLDPREPEIAYLRGLALLRIGKHEEALTALGESVGVREDGAASSKPPPPGARSTFARYAEAYLAAATALEKLERWPQAEDALVMATEHNSSLVEPLVRLARARRAQGNTSGADDAIRAARKTFHELPGFMRRRQLGWGVRAYLG